jgi:serine protease Do
VKVLRDGREQTMTVKLAERPGRETSASQNVPAPAPPVGARPDQEPVLGLTVRDLDRFTAERLDLPKDMRGVLITRVEPLSSSFDADVQRGTVLLEINRQATTSTAEYRRLARTARSGDILTLFVYSPDLDQRQVKTIRVEQR